MNGAQLHLLLNHLPIFTPVFGLTIFSLGFFLKQPKYLELALWFFVFGGLFAVPTYLSGESAEKVVKNYPVMSQNWLNEHEEMAVKALTLSLTLSVASSLLLFILRKGKKIPNLAWSALALVALFTFALFLQTAHYGGQVVHEEIRKGEFSNE